MVKCHVVLMKGLLVPALPLQAAGGMCKHDVVPGKKKAKSMSHPPISVVGPVQGESREAVLCCGGSIPLWSP